MALSGSVFLAGRPRRPARAFRFVAKASPMLPCPPPPAPAHPATAAAGPADVASFGPLPYLARVTVFPVATPAATLGLAAAAPTGAAPRGAAVPSLAPVVVALAAPAPSASAVACPAAASRCLTAVATRKQQTFSFSHYISYAATASREDCCSGSPTKACESAAGAAGARRSRAAAASRPTTGVICEFPVATSASAATFSPSSRLGAACPRPASGVAAPTFAAGVRCRKCPADALMDGAAWPSSAAAAAARTLSDRKSAADTSSVGAAAAFSAAGAAVQTTGTAAVPTAATATAVTTAETASTTTAVPAPITSAQAAGTTTAAPAAIATAKAAVTSLTCGAATSSTAVAAACAAGDPGAAVGERALSAACAAVEGPLRGSEQRLFYYRFHKHLGKGNFNRYIEFYRKPRGIENTLRLRFNYLPTFSEKKRSLMWNVHLMKKLAQATDSKQVLDVWCYYRHKKYKRPYHYVAFLRRLVEVGGCDPTDYRFRIIANGVLRSAKRFINLPRVCLQLALLNARGDLQQLSRFLPPRIPSYFPHQLCVLLQAFGLVKLQDKQLFAVAEEALRPHLAYLSTANLLKIARAFADVLIHNYAVLAQISVQLQLRAGAANWLSAAAAARKRTSPLEAAAAGVTQRGAVHEGTDAEEDPSLDGGKSLEAGGGPPPGDPQRRAGRRVLRLQKDEQQQQHRATEAAWELQRARSLRHQGLYLPSFSQLVAFGSACATLKYREFGFLELLSMRMQEALRKELEDRSEEGSFRYFSPHTVKEAVEMLQRLKVNDVPLLLRILQHVDVRLCDYPPSCLASIGLCSAQLLPCGHPFVRRVHGRMLEALEEALAVMDWSAVQQVAAFAKKMRHRKVAGEASPRLRICEEVERRLVALQGDVHTVFDVPRLMELLSLNGRVIGDEAFTILCVQTHRHLELFEPVDFCRMARALARIAAASSQHAQSSDTDASTGRVSSQILTCPPSLAEARSVKRHSLDLVNALARRALRLHDEFSLRDFSSLLRHLRAAGPPHQRYALPLQQRLREKERLSPEETELRSRKEREQNSLADDTPATDFDVPAEQLPPSSRKGTALRRGRLLLGKEAARRQGKNQLLEEEPELLPGAREGAAPEIQEKMHPVFEESEAAERAAGRWRRRGLEARLRIAEEEGWNLLHRRVASLRELRGWL